MKEIFRKIIGGVDHLTCLNNYISENIQLKINNTPGKISALYEQVLISPVCKCSHKFAQCSKEDRIATFESCLMNSGQY